MVQRLWIMVALATGVVACGSGAATAEPLAASEFAHESGSELSYTEGVAVPFGETDMYSIEYSNPAGDRVTGLIAYPEEGATTAGILVIPGLPESAAQNREPLADMSCLGAITLVINPPYVREGRMDGALTFTATDSEEQIAFIVEARRAVDVLEELGAEKIGVSAASWGGAIGAMLVGLEPRIDAAALMVANGSVVDRFMKDGEPVSPLSELPESQRHEWIEVMAPLDSTLYVGQSPAQILFLNGNDDPFVTRVSAEKLHDAAPDSSEVEWYDGGHDPSNEMIASHLRFLGDQLDLDPDRVETCIAQRTG